MRTMLITLTLLTVTGCSWERMAHYSPYDLNYDGQLDAVCPGMTYDTNEYYHYSWRSKASTACNEEVYGDQHAS
ncbi:hypothetical protein [Candidatus Marimicrobium litorale]|jgi:hypothetical protein|uniref:Lipoprotein n=1 Tax=Candidatus Marimicrobium litorale TaxID=2518991 RepID=A0ABT3T9G9_9GAMM|nr:hypothetical protein [Candidatus Marimicrobium litorale]MCX2978470.1 hypothetical protein [Candidatus Marimicrobium litorale]